MRRLRREHHRVLAARAIGADRVKLVIERMEGCVRQPSLVEVQILDIFAERFLDRLDVVDDTIVRGLGERHHAWSHALVPDQRIRIDLALNRLGVEFFKRNRADDSKVIARGLKEDRQRAGHHERMQHRFMAVAIDQYDIVRAHRRMPHDLVRGGRAVGDEEQVIGVEDPRRVALGRRDRPGVVKQLA